MLLLKFPRLANKAVVLTCLLAVTSFLAGSWQAQGQSPTANPTTRTSVPSAGLVALEKHVPSKVLDGTAMRVGHYNPEQKLRLVLTIQPPHMAEEEQFIKELVTKGSPNFHKFLTLDQWNERYAPSVQDEQAVVDWAESVGLTVTKRYSDRLIVNVEGTAGTIEKAFGVTINNYQVGDEVDFSNDRDPVIPTSLSGILSFVTGLSNVERPHRLGSRNATVKGADYVAGPEISEPGNAQADGDPKKAPASASRPLAMTSKEAAKNESASLSIPKSNDNYPLDEKSGTYAMDPSNVQSSNGYDFNALQKLSHCCNEPGASAGSPPESSIALVGYGGFLVSDVSTFASAYGMAYNLSWYCIGGGSCPGNDGEAPLDVEYSMAMSNSYGSYLDTAHIYEYEMTNGLYTTYESAFNDIVSDGHAKVVSTSYGWQENVGFSGSVATGTMHPIFNTMVGTGITLIAASGDNGASDGCDDATSVDYPSSDPDFIAAGGTQLNMYTNGIFYSETAWQGETWSGACGSNHGGSTGGVSVLFAAPSWQKITNSTYPDGVVSPFYLWKAGSEYVETGNGNRMVPDISLTANPDVLGQWYVSGGSWQDEGGTSIVAPELAGFFAQENSYLDYVGSICGSGSTACSPIGLASPYMYQDAIYGAPHDPFYDMVSGCNNNDDTATYNLYYYCAYTGYDPITGWGSANMMQLAWGINWWVIPAAGVPSLSFGGPTINTWYNSDQIVDWDLNDSGGSYPAPGAAGFTLAWDSIPSDSHSEPHGGDGDTFYTGPQYSFSTFGCVDNNGTYCEAASGQGCHTVYVRGWDNQGNVTNGSYGPVCFDSVAPTITASTNPATSGSVWVDKSVKVTLTATDPGGSSASGIQATYYAINTGACYPANLGACTLYTGPFTVSGQQQSYIYYFTEDNAGNFSSEPYIWVSIDLTAPTTTATPTGDLQGGIYYSKVSIALSASDTGGSGVANTYYILDGGAQTTYTGSAIVVSTNANHTFKYWSVDAAGNVEAQHTFSFTIAPDTATSMTTPTAGSTLAGPSVTFSWAAAAGANGYFLHLGSTGPGSANLYAPSELTTTSVTVNGLPTNGETIYARLFTDYNGVHVYKDYTFTAAAQAVLTTPTPGTTLAGPSVTFSWPAATGSVNGYFLHVGSTGAGSDNLYVGSEFTTTSLTVNGLPLNGGTIYVRLFTDYGGTHVHQDFTYTAAQQAVLTTPTPGTTLAGPSVTFSWPAATGSVNGYFLHVGSTGAGSDNLYVGSEFTTTSLTVNGLPLNGEPIYVRLFTDYGGTHVHQDFTYTAAQQAVLTTPTPSTQLTGPSVTFSWPAATGSVNGYFLHVGSTGAGSDNLYAGSEFTTTSLTVNGLPVNGGTIYVRLFTDYGGTHVYQDFTYTAAQEAVLTTPTPGSTLAGSSVTFGWAAATGSVNGYFIHVGSTGVGSDNLNVGSELSTATLTKTVSGLPTTGGTIYVRLFTDYGGTHVYQDYTYTAQ